MFSNMTYEEWTAALIPKVRGTWNLHCIFQTTPLDFLVLFSSVMGMMDLAAWPIMPQPTLFSVHL
jgi:hypothetical protein